MRNPLQISVLVILVLQFTICSAQNFRLTCYNKGAIPDLYFQDRENVFDNLLLNKIPLIKDSDSRCYLDLNPNRISFAKIGGDAVIIVPGEHVTGIFSRSNFSPMDSGTINFRLSQIKDQFYRIRNNYRIGSNYDQFQATLNLLFHFKDSVINALVSQDHLRLNENINIALKEYLNTLLAHYLVLPILFKNNFDLNDLTRTIHKNIQIRYPEYWLQLEPGRIFLNTYFRKIRLKEAAYNFQRALEDRIFMFSGIRKLMAYNYFLECLQKGVIKDRDQLLDDWKEICHQRIFSEKEQAVLNDLHHQIEKIGLNITNVFGKLPLISTKGKLISTEENKSIINKPRVILEFWASWCEPCKARMKKINSDMVTIENKKYHIIYISLDENESNWQDSRFLFLNKSNSFRVSNPNNSFFDEFNIRMIPRYMLIHQSTLISDDFEF